MSTPLDPLDENMKDFLRACVNGKFDEVKAMIETSDENNRRELFSVKDTDYGRNALHWAVYHYDIEAIKYLITFREVRIRTMDKKLETVFIRALNPGPALPIISINDYWVRSPKPTMEMLKILLEADGSFITFYIQTDPLSIAIKRQSIEVIEFLVERGSDVNNCLYAHGRNRGWNALHRAAHRKRIDVIRFLLEKTTCNRLLKDNWGYVPCCVYMRRVAYSSARTIVTMEMIDFCDEFMSLTFESPEQCYEVHLLLFRCIERKNKLNENATIPVVCQRIVKFLIAYNPDKCLADLVEQLCDEKYLTLVSLLMYENLLCHFDDCEKGFLGFDIVIDSVGPLVEELFNLYLVNEQLTNEFVKRIAKTKFASFVGKQLRESVPWDRKQVPLQTIYNFAKMLLSNGVDVFEKHQQIYARNQPRWEYLLQAIVPLCSYVRVPLELAFHVHCARSVRNFNESKNWIEDYRNCKKRQFTRGVVSLKNLARTTIRKHLFQNGNVYEKLTALHSMELPRLIINLICYNDDNLEL